MKFKLKLSEDNQYYFVLVGRNGKVIMTSEVYKSKRNALKTLKAIKLKLPHFFVDVIDETI